VSDAQVRKLMEEMSKHGEIGRASMIAGMDRKTGRKYAKAAALPSQMKKPREWLTRENPFADDWVEIEDMLATSPELEAKTIFEVLEERHPGRYEPGQLRTLQRHMKRWRAQHGPEREVMFAQAHRPGEAAQTDFTWATEFGVTIAGQLFAHMLCVFVLPYSNWQWATVCLSESLAALRRGVQAALFQLGRVPQHHQTDNSTAATHRIPAGDAESVEGRKRPFNKEYVVLMSHYGMKPRTTEVGEKEQNGDVEASNGALKRKLEQALLIRGDRDFESPAAWEAFVHDVIRKANRARGTRVAEELKLMRPLDVKRLPEFTEERVRVSEWSTIRVKQRAYSVPSRLIGEWVRVHVYDDRIEAYYANQLQLCCERIRDRYHRIDYRHVIWSLVRKPGAFARYVYREELFPSVTFRRAYDTIQDARAGTKGDLEYLRILHLAASTLEADVEAALELLLAEGRTVSSDAVKAIVNASGPEGAMPALEPLHVDLGAYDALFEEVGS
jgi:hypothetical protein